MTHPRPFALAAFALVAALGLGHFIEHAARANGGSGSAVSAPSDAGPPPDAVSGSAAAPTAVPLSAVPVAPAASDAAPPPVINPATEAFDLIAFARTGKGRLAAGALVMLLVWGLRAILVPRVSWFGTTSGGYVLGFGTTAAAYVGTALGTNAPLTLDLGFDALAVAFAASGKWEALRDAITSLGKPAGPAMRAVGAVTGVLVGVWLASTLVASSAGCHPLPSANTAGHDVIDCAKADQSQLLQLGGELAGLQGAGRDWADIEAKAETSAVDVGGCALAQLVQQYLSGGVGSAAPKAEDGRKAATALEAYRSKRAHGASFRTKAGGL